jgi:predicted metal-dependent HD superfamily phosphohydrolase
VQVLNNSEEQVTQPAAAAPPADGADVAAAAPGRGGGGGGGGWLASQFARAIEGLPARMQRDVTRAAEDAAVGDFELGARWRALTVEALGLAAPLSRSWWRRIHDGYGREPQRFYHDLHHLRAMLRELDLLLPPTAAAAAAAVAADNGDSSGADTSVTASVAVSRQRIELATFFHDLVYEPTSKENEGRSAELFREFAAQAGVDAIDAETAQLVDSWIKRTANHMDGPATGDLATFLDIDISVRQQSMHRCHAVCSARRCLCHAGCPL